ncbi:Signal transduction histidine kinase [Desulfoscipio geothermicus DSM 3669]|uniref:histidine kinase n=1 Tax=Desulfoscipio geothermicus DSM 3669 TaxID=1121426 RepID=A0A1I6EL72_9FIRM|nr:Signal transduction histidine kinase [Desulfoscipio geothermicus DSM 3669]
MDTKWKNFKYSPGAKISAFVMVWLCVMVAAGSAVFLGINHHTINSDSYYDTYQFKNQFGSLVRDAVALNVELVSEEEIRFSGDTEEEINNNIHRYYAIKGRLADTVNFAYYIENTRTGETFTNITSGDAPALIQKQPAAVYYDRWKTDYGYPFAADIAQMLADTPYEVHAAVIEPLKPGDFFYDGSISYSKTKELANHARVALISAIFIALLAFIYQVCVTGRREQGGEITLSFVDRIFADVHTILVLVAAVISLAIANSFSFSFPNEIELIVLVIIFGVDVLIGLTYILSMTRQIKSGRMTRNTLVYRLFDMCFKGKAFKPWTLLLLLGYGAVNGILFTLANETREALFIFIVLIIPFNIAVLYFTAKALTSLSEIMQAVKEISAGNLDYALDKSQVSVAFAGLAEDIQSIQGGLKKAVAEAIKGERMKTDLITNVSHDLKTPLTSVINYIDLLKKEELNNEKAREYLSVLDEKSARLKQLIEDLIEASKASSGNLAVCVEKVDLHELVMQACGEYEEKIKKAGLELHVNAGEEKTSVSADGKHMWRIVENLLSNVVKYSLPHSRVYINIAKSEPYGLLVVKNISANPLDISPEQLTERFVRGDASRTTEGSGLGLSIAQSLTRIQGGRFKIDIDGDLFKVTVEMPL